MFQALYLVGAVRLSFNVFGTAPVAAAVPFTAPFFSIALHNRLNHIKRMLETKQEVCVQINCWYLFI
jgi:hypothetical protein